MSKNLDSTQPRGLLAPVEQPQLAVVADDRYEIHREIAHGAMGKISAARDVRHGRPVAIKELLPGNDGARRRFEREALVTARLQHPSIVAVYEAGRWRDGSPFYAMKLVEGRPLADVITDARTLDQRLALLPHVQAGAAA